MKCTKVQFKPSTMPTLRKGLPVFVRCEDGKFYEDLVYGDFPIRRAWFLCFDPEGPAEIVIKKSEFAGGNFGPKDILLKRGFGKVLSAIVGGADTSYIRFFGHDEKNEPTEAAAAISWFCGWKTHVPFPVPNKYDEHVEIWPVHPAKPGVYFGI
jgi:hypothetical protein